MAMIVTVMVMIYMKMMMAIKVGSPLYRSSMLQPWKEKGSTSWCISFSFWLKLAKEKSFKGCISTWRSVRLWSIPSPGDRSRMNEDVNHRPLNLRLAACVIMLPMSQLNLKAIFLPQEKIVDGHLFLGALSWVTTCTNNKSKFYIKMQTKLLVLSFEKHWSCIPLGKKCLAFSPMDGA